MPELPEVENVARALRQTLLGRRLDGIQVRFAGALKPSPRIVKRAALGKRLSEVRRHGKYLFLRFRDDSPASIAAVRAAETTPPYDSASRFPKGVSASTTCVTQLMLHLRMTGQVFVDPDYRPDKHVRLVFDFEGLPVYYRDMRKFGGFTLVENAARPDAIEHVGPDMLEISFAEWSRRMGRRHAPLKSLLLDQGVAAGLGNIYADEALFRAKVHPLLSPPDLDEESLRRIYHEARQILRLAIRHGGTTYINFVNFRGKPGNFRKKLKVYGREGESCSVCGSVIERLKVSGRSTHFCPACQPSPRGGNGQKRSKR